MCGNVLHVGVQQPIMLSQLQPARALPNDSPPSPVEPGVDVEPRDADLSDAQSMETMSRVLSTSIWVEHCRQVQSAEPHAV